MSSPVPTTMPPTSPSPPSPPVSVPSSPKQSFSGLQLSSQDVRDLLEEVDFSDSVREGEFPSQPHRMDIVPLPSTSRVLPGPSMSPQLSSQDVRDILEGVDFSDSVREGEFSSPALRMNIVPLPSTSRVMPGPSMSCVMPCFGSRQVPDTAGAANILPPAFPGTFRIVDERERQYRNFEMLAREVTVHVDPPHHEDNPYRWLRDTFNVIIGDLITDNIAPQDRIGFTFFSAARVGQRPIGLSVRRRDQFNIDVLLQLIERCVQSNEEFLIAGPLRIVFLHVQVPMSGINNPRIDYT